MENTAMNNLAMTALINESLPALASPTLHETSAGTSLLILSILGIGLAFYVLICCCQCLVDDDRMPQSRATVGSYYLCMEDDERNPQSHATVGSYSVCLGEDDRRRQSRATMGADPGYMEYETRSQLRSTVGTISLLMVLLFALAAFVVGIVKLTVWVVHLCGAIHVPIWLANLWDSATAWVIHAWNCIEMPILHVLWISLALIVVLYCGLWLIGFEDYGIAPGSYAAMWMSSIGNVVAGSLYALLQAIAMGGKSVFTVLLYIVPCVALAVGSFEIVVWLLHSGAVRVPTWMVDCWDSASDWVLHAWDSGEIRGWWDSFVAWLRNLWDSVAAWFHHAWDFGEIRGWWDSFVAWLHNLWDSTAAWFHRAWDVDLFGWWDSFVTWLHNVWESITDHHKWKIYN